MISVPATGVKRRAQVWKSVRRAAVRRRDHRYDAFLVIKLVEESPRADPVSPRLRRVALQLTNVWPELRVLTQLRLNGSPQPADDLCATSPGDRL